VCVSVCVRYCVCDFVFVSVRVREGVRECVCVSECVCGLCV